MKDLVFRLGGEGGEGVLSTGQLLTLALARAGYEIYTYQTYPAEIKGGHANFQVRAASELLLSQGDHPDVLLAFNEEAFQKHVKDLRDDSVIVYDSDAFQPNGDFHGVTYGIPMTTIAIEKIGLKLSKNMVALGAMAGLFGAPLPAIEAVVRAKFSHKGEEILQKNLEAVRAGFAYAQQHVQKHDPYQLEAVTRQKPELVLSGNDSLALGAMYAGLRLYAGYPITPATDIMEFLAEELPKVGGVVVQTEDEIAAIGTVVGASYAGTKAMTATSGPGLSLMVEFLGLSTMAEVPIVVVDVQRVGPSTGMPTKTEQGDLYLAVYGGHGNCPRIVMALSSVEDCFHGIIRAFNLAEQFQMPVVVLSDQYLGHRKATVPKPDTSTIRLIERAKPSAEELKDYKRYRFTASGISPMAMPGVEGGGYVATGLEHNEYGDPAASNHENHLRMTEKRYKKFAAVEPIANDLVKFYGVEKPQIGIIGWGSSEGVIREAVAMAVAKGYSVGALHPKILYPLPIAKLTPFIKQCKRVIIPEVNYTGQFATLLHKRFSRDFDQLNKCLGLPFTPLDILNKIEEVITS